MKRLLIYSDCYVYGGSERLMSSIIRSRELNAEYEILMAYRAHRMYDDGLAVDYSPEERTKYLRPLCIFSHATLSLRLHAEGVPSYVRIAVLAPFRIAETIGIYRLWNMFRLFFLLQRVRPDVLHINNGGYPGARSCTDLALVASFLHLGKTVYQVNNMARPPTGWFARFIDRHLSKSCQFVTASKFSQNRLRSLRGFPSSVLTQVYNTAPLESVVRTRADVLREWSLPDDTIILSMVAFLSARKGQRYLLGALALLRSRAPNLLRNVVLFLVGSGEDELSLKAQCQESGLNENVRFAGYRNDSIEYIAHCDIFLLPSIADEDMPLVVLSAMKHGKTIIASRLGGIEEQIGHGVSGILVNVDHSTLAAALADAIEEQLLYPRAQLGRNAKERYETLFSASAYAQSLMHVYSSSNGKNATA
jgi:glycosyltransferase involved in cell wall biosynthesis